MSNQDNQKQAEQIEYIRSYALENYDKGWDEVIECWGNQDIAEVIKRGTHPNRRSGLRSTTRGSTGHWEFG